MPDSTPGKPLAAAMHPGSMATCAVSAPVSRFDIVVPCFNYASYLRSCVHSVLEQPGVEVRILIIDDASTDDTPDVARAIAREGGGRLQFRRHAANIGHIATYNEGLLEWAESEFVLLISADDMLAPGALARAARALSAHPDAGMCFGRQLLFHDAPPGGAEPANGTFTLTKVPGGAFIESSCREGGNPVATPTAVVRTALQRAAGDYNPQLPHTADLEMWLRLAARAPVVRIDAVQAYKREHALNMQKSYTRALVPDLDQRKRAFESALALLEDRATAEALRRCALEALAREAFWTAHGCFEDGVDDACDKLLAFSADLDAAWTASVPWKRLRWKRRIGRRAWRVVDQLVTAARHAPARGEYR